MKQSNEQKIIQIQEDASIERQQLEEAVSFALNEAKKGGCDAEVSITKSTGISISSRLGEVETLEFNCDGALGISVFLGHKKGNASSTDLRPETIKKTVAAAINIAKYSAEDPCAGIADAELLAFEDKDLDLFYPSALNTDEALSMAIEAENTARSFDKRIVNSDGASVNSHYRVNVFGNSHGMLQSQLSSIHSLSCSVIAQHKESMEREYAYTVSREYDQMRSAHTIGRECAQKALERLNPMTIKTMQCPVIFFNEVATGLIGHLVGAIAGGSVYRKSTFLLDSLHKQIMPNWLTINEDPHVLKGLGSSFYDSEGVKTQPRKIIDQGMLPGWLLGSYSARKLGLISTGHAGGIYNWFINDDSNQHSVKNLDELLKQMDKGLLITELMGQGVNNVTGDYSRGASGFWIEQGKIQYPVSGITIAGNLKQMWQQIVSIGHDIETRSSIQTGSILIENMQVAGK